MSEHHNAAKEAVESTAKVAGGIGGTLASGAEKLAGEGSKHPLEAAKLSGEAAEYAAKAAAGAAGALISHSGHGKSASHGIGHKVRAARGHPVTSTGHQHSVGPGTPPAVVHPSSTAPVTPVHAAPSAPTHHTAPAAPVASQTHVGHATVAVGSAKPAVQLSPERQAAIHADVAAKFHGDKRLAQNRPGGLNNPHPEGGGSNTKQNHQQQWATRRKKYGNSGRSGHP